MSGIFKAIGKVFKKVVNVVKKIALPALAIAAVVLTGGAALGALPALSSTIGGLGLSTGLTSVLTTAAQGATMGFVGGVLTGKNPLKAATTGLITGGILGGANVALGGAGGPISANGSAIKAVDPNSALGASGGLGTAGANAGDLAAANADLVPTASRGLMQTVPASSGGGLGGWLERNPIVGGQLIAGLGQGISAAQQAKDQRKAQQRITDSYEGTGGLWLGDTNYAAPPVAQGLGQTTVPAGPAPITRFDAQYYYDPKSGRIRNAAGGN